MQVGHAPLPSRLVAALIDSPRMSGRSVTIDLCKSASWVMVGRDEWTRIDKAWTGVRCASLAVPSRRSQSHARAGPTTAIILPSLPASSTPPAAYTRSHVVLQLSTGRPGPDSVRGHRRQEGTSLPRAHRPALLAARPRRTGAFAPFLGRELISCCLAYRGLTGCVMTSACFPIPSLFSSMPACVLVPLTFRAAKMALACR